MMRCLRSVRIFIVLEFAFCFATRTAHAQFVEEIDAVVGKILMHPAIQGGPIIVGGFLSNPQQDLHAAPTIKHHIVDCLHRKGVKVEKRGRFPAISGSYGYADKKALVDIEFDLTDPGGKRLAVFPVQVTFAEDNRHMLDIAAPSAVKLKADASGYDRGKSVVEALKAPKATIADTHVCAPQGSYHVTIVCEEGGAFRPVGVEDQDGYGFVKMKMHQTYRILLKNNSPYEAVAKISIDGLDSFVFADKKSPGYLIAANGGEHEVIGWFVNNTRADAFVVGKFSDTPAAEILGEAADEGVICVQFSAAWESEKPADEGGTLSGVGTLVGEPLQQNVKPVPRKVGKVREVVSIRYGV